MNEAEKEQALKLSGLYKELAEKGTWFEVRDVVDVWHKGDMCPSLVSTLSEWRVAEPEKKIIDLTKMIGSDVDMEFGEITRENAAVIGKLTDIEECSDHVKYSRNHKQTGWYHHCRI
ncbi:MAG: hypothetical protein GY814_20795, partial [Gammaproteobacteria bacterium]|nr:hypothetical protein [Gammaproteobacteria bacterium]